MQKKIMRCFAVIIVFCTVLTMVFSYLVTIYNHKNDVVDYLESVCRFIEKDLASMPIEETAKKYAGTDDQYRVTYISPSGTVQYDTYLDDAENHLDRSEVQEALSGGFGSSIRYSHSMHRFFIYSALRLSDGSIVRMATDLKPVSASLFAILAFTLLFALGTLCISFLIARHFSLSITNPVKRLEQYAQKAAGGTVVPLQKDDMTEELASLADSIEFMNETLSDSISRLSALEKVRSEFVSNVSHELKTPLTSIRGFIETLKGGAVTNEAVANRFLDIIDIEASRLQMLINDILELSDIERMETDEAMMDFDLSSAAADCVQLISGSADEKSISIIFRRTNALWVHANPDRIKQVMLNLLSNAVKYTDEGGSIRMSVAKDSLNAVISVTDTGMGIPEESLGRLFERFYRVDKGRSRASGGTGLGLSIVKHIVDLYDGEIEVQSEMGKGSEFIVKLPIVLSNIL